MEPEGPSRTCPICEEAPWTVECGECEAHFCTACVKRYLSESVSPPHCMGCSAAWPLRFLKTVLPKSWLNSNAEGGFRAARKNTMLQLEKAKLEETNRYIAEELRPDTERAWALKRHQVDLARLKLEKYELELELTPSRVDKVLDIPVSRRDAAKERLQEVKRQISEITQQKKHDHVLKPKVREFLCFCPHEDCRGMVGTTGGCTICDRPTCAKCHKPLSKDPQRRKSHRCHKADVETARLLRRTTKDCPRCHWRISKIDGCDQMWCPGCKGTFSWETGRATNEEVHNPHAIAWMRKHGGLRREAGDVPCGGFTLIGADVSRPTEAFGQAFAGSAYAENIDLGRLALTERAFRSFVDLFYQLDASLERLAARDVERDLRKARVDYCLGRKSEDEWKNAIFRTMRAGERDRVKRDAIQTLRDLSVERFNEIADISGCAVDEDMQALEQDIERFDAEMDVLRQFGSPEVVQDLEVELAEDKRRLDAMKQEKTPMESTREEADERLVQLLGELLELLGLTERYLNEELATLDFRKSPHIRLIELFDSDAGKKSVIFRWEGLK